jgi:Secretion system C-terminal sorting domain/FG-GAP-like repeat
MKTKLFLLFTAIICTTTYAQIEFEEHTITIKSAAARSVYTADIDGDGDMDVLSASTIDNKIAWYENLDGLGNFSTQQVITTNALGARSVYAEDIDGDMDMDVVSASAIDAKVAWYENTDGQGNFGAQQIITTDADGAKSVYVTDIDGDGDMDVLSASFVDNKIAWYENIDGLGNFGSQQIVTTNADRASSVYAVDLDGDGDKDVVSASSGDNKIAWYENLDGLGNFGAQQTITSIAVEARSVYATDIDGDGDMDVLSASGTDSKVAWYENLDGLGSFGSQQVISTKGNFPLSVYAEDIDGDGDMDVLSASTIDSKLAWYENTDGQGNFGPQQVISTNADGVQWVYASDIDDDGDVDVLSASFTDDKIAWHENLGVLGINENTLIDFAVYPNPTTAILTVQSSKSIVQIEIYNALGQLVLSNTNENQIDISSVSQGIYFIKIKDGHSNFGTKRVVKQ